MLARALIVLLLMLNLGVAAWWALQPPPQLPKVEQPQGVARLQLLSELPRHPAMRQRPKTSSPPSVGPATTAATQTPAEATISKTVESSAPAVDASSKAQQCFSLGPFPTTAAATAARAQLLPQVKAGVVKTRSTPSLGWRVWLPPLESTEAAQAMAKRIGAAGFSDYLVLRIGGQANAIALGSYRSEDAARRRAAALSAAGFPAQLEPMGDTQPTVWLDISGGPGFDADKAQTLVSAPSRQALDCALMR